MINVENVKLFDFKCENFVMEFKQQWVSWQNS